MHFQDSRKVLHYVLHVGGKSAIDRIQKLRSSQMRAAVSTVIGAVSLSMPTTAETSQHGLGKVRLGYNPIRELVKRMNCER